MKQKLASLIILPLLFCLTAAASETSSSISVEKSDIKKNKIEDLDKEVTDPKLRAKSGSKSRWSGTLSLNYNGGSLEDPFSEERPNVADESNPIPVYVAGNVGIRYRANKNESFYLATGLTMPLAGTNENNLEATNPFLSYNDTFAYDDVQMSSSIMATIYTQEYAREYGSVASLYYDLTSLNQISDSRFYGGVSFSPYFNIYDKDSFGQMDYGLALSPTLQYRWNDWLNFYTTLSPFSYNHIRDEDMTDLRRSPTTQSVGAGMAVTRNVYLSPSFFFQPSNISADTTAFNISAHINLL